MKELRYCVLTILWPVLNGYAQTPSDIQPLQIGDTLPDVEFSNVYHYPVSKIRLSDLKGKLVILDYWATWCGSCLKMVPRLDSLQQEFGDNLQILMIGRQGNGDDITKVNNTLGRLKLLSPSCNFSIPIITGDTFALQHYELMVLPHYIWIDDKRIIRGITDSDQITSANIEAIIKGKAINLPLKEDKFGR